MSSFLKALLLNLLLATTAYAVNYNECLPEQLRQRLWVDTPIDGLYDAIPGKNFIQFNNIQMETDSGVIKQPPVTLYTTNVFIQNGSEEVFAGVFKREVSLDGTEFVFNSAFLKLTSELERAPSWVKPPGVPELQPGKGIPTHLFVTLNQMKLAKIKPGQLKKATVSEVSNLETSLHMVEHPIYQRWRRENPNEGRIPGSVISEIFLASPTGRYVATTLTQSGHKIKSIKSSNVILTSVAEFLKPPGFLTQSEVELVKQKGDLLVPYFIHKVELELEPIQKP